MTSFPTSATTGPDFWLLLQARAARARHRTLARRMFMRRFLRGGGEEEIPERTPLGETLVHGPGRGAQLPDELAGALQHGRPGGPPGPQPHPPGEAGSAPFPSRGAG